MMSDKRNIIMKKAKNIKLLACDVDGVLTRGEIIILDRGSELKIWNVKDGMGYNELLKTVPKIKTAWITGRQSNQVEKRAKDMGIDYLIQNCVNKKKALEKILKKNNLSMTETAYMGDDVVDLSVLKAVGFSTCPIDACEDVKKNVDYISSFEGGKGAMREIIEIVMRAKGEWQKALSRYTC
ncbi:MAG: HAD hydrolase family protein [Endomicrobium sp.]|nr:HAD hydrolase family protein [Endomicrobium sp.]